MISIYATECDVENTIIAKLQCTVIVIIVIFSFFQNGYTPLHIAAKKNEMDIATTLLEYGAKPNAESKVNTYVIYRILIDLELLSYLMMSCIICKQMNPK